MFLRNKLHSVIGTYALVFAKRVQENVKKKKYVKNFIYSK
jgi:hypothetical protein